MLELTVRRVENILQSQAQGKTRLLILFTAIIVSQPSICVLGGLKSLVSLDGSSSELDVVNREARERFAAGYIQCMHEVHSFVSNCPGIDPAVAADLLNHLLESMPLNDEDRLQVMMSDIFSDCPPHHNNSSSSTWSESGRSSPCSPGSPALSPAPSSSTDDLCSDLEETDSEQSNLSIHEGEIQDVSCLQYLSYPKSMWRPW